MWNEVPITGKPKNVRGTGSATPFSEELIGVMLCAACVASPVLPKSSDAQPFGPCSTRRLRVANAAPVVVAPVDANASAAPCRRVLLVEPNRGSAPNSITFASQHRFWPGAEAAGGRGDGRITPGALVSVPSSRLKIDSKYASHAPVAVRR